MVDENNYEQNYLLEKYNYNKLQNHCRRPSGAYEKNYFSDDENQKYKKNKNNDSLYEIYNNNPTIYNNDNNFDDNREIKYYKSYSCDFNINNYTKKEDISKVNKFSSENFVTYNYEDTKIYDLVKIISY